MARRALPGHARVRGDVAAGRRSRASAATGCTRCSTRPPRSTSGTSGNGRGRARPRVPRGPRPPRGGLPRVPARALARPGLAAEGAPEGVHARRAASAPGLTNARGNDYFPQRLMFPLIDARGRVVGFQARKLREDDPLRGKYVNSPEGELFHKSSRSLRPQPRTRRRSPSRSAPSSSRATPT